MKIVAAKSILKANDQLAAENRARFDAAGVFCVNVVGSPGCGKTTLLEALLAALPPHIAPAVIEGDIAGSIDAQRIEALGLPVVQINTDGACHLDANMIASAADGFDLDRLDLLVIENVGNLVCTAGFDLGEHLRIVILSVSEGDDKAVKYPAIFQGSDALAVTKIDLLPHSDFRLARIEGDMKRLAPEAMVFPVSAKSGEGIPALADWLAGKTRRMKGLELSGDRPNLLSDGNATAPPVLERRFATSVASSFILRVQPALGLRRPAPATGPLVLARADRPRAGPAADARIPLVVQRIVRHALLDDPAPDVLLRPGGQGTDLHQAEFLVPADDRRVGAGGRPGRGECRSPRRQTPPPRGATPPPCGRGSNDPDRSGRPARRGPPRTRATESSGRCKSIVIPYFSAIRSRSSSVSRNW